MAEPPPPDTRETLEPEDANPLEARSRSFVNPRSVARRAYGDMTEPDVAVACGVITIAAAAKLLDKDVETSQLISPVYISSASGSRLTDLTAAAKQCGLQAMTLTRLSSLDLSTIELPAVLHVKSRPWSEDYNHYVLIVSRDDNGLTIFDANPRRDELEGAKAEGDKGFALIRISYDALAMRWSGDALLVSASGQDRSFMSGLFITSNLLRLACLGMTVLAVFAASESMKRMPMRGSCAVAAMLVGLVAIGSSVGVLFNTAMYGGLIRNSDLVRTEIDRWHTAGLIEQISVAALARLIEDHEDIVLIDARTVEDYARGHIPGAICVPVTTVREASLVGLDSIFDKKVIVYCSSEDCDAAELVAQRLHWEGVSDIAVLRHGISGWEAAGFSLEGHSSHRD